jgi:hypothetical protein
MSWWTSSPAIYGAELRAGALCLVDHGWPVVPGSWCRRDGCDRTGDRWGRGPVPAVPGGVSVAGCDPDQVARWWSGKPYPVLLATGGPVDAVEVPAWMGRRMAKTLRCAGMLAPLAATPAGRWWFPVPAGPGRLPEEVRDAGGALHGPGSWVIAPPSECADGLVHWRVHPSTCGWQLPELELVRVAAVEAARWRESVGHPAVRPSVGSPAGGH